jgi:acyl carrier protein
MTSSVEYLIREWIMQHSDNTVLADGDLFLEFGLNSLQFAELISHIEEQFQIEIDFSKLIDWEAVKTLSGLVRYIEIGFAQDS